MITTIILIVASLVALNFFLLIFSCNKTTKKEVVKNFKFIQQRPTVITNQYDARQLAPTGS